MEGALVSLYGQSQQVGKNGCFVFDLADALPLSFTTTASGYASYERAAQSGFFRVVVVLEPSTSGKASTAEWTEIPRREFAGAGKECR